MQTFDLDSLGPVTEVRRREPNRFQSAIYQDVREGSGHTVVIARAGTGKTTTIVDAFSEVPAGLSTLMLAFNKKIAEELKNRAPAGVDVLTCHSHGLRTVTKGCGRPQVDQDKTYKATHALYPNASREVVRILGKLVSLSKATLAESESEIDSLIDEFGLLDEEEDETRPRPGVLGRRDLVRVAIRLLDHARKNTAVIDFDDMIWLPVTLGLAPARRYDRVFVDETQDLNRAQIELALAACRSDGRICAVGDDRQAIYAFRGADENAIPNLIDRLGAKTLPLSVTYRCPKSIVRLANEFVSDFEAAPTAPEGEIENADERRMVREAGPGDFVISRANAPLIGHCFDFLKQGRRAKILGRDLGASLAALVNKSHAQTVVQLTIWLDRYRDREISKLLAKSPPQEKAAELVADKIECLHALAQGADTVAEIEQRIDHLFSDSTDANSVVFTTTHKAKGLETERVWVLAETYRPYKSTEEANLWYVAITRAKSRLFVVRKES